MPPKAKYTRDEILEKAFSMVRKHGPDILTARSLAAELGTSTAPIFTAFDSTEELQSSVIKKAEELYARYADEGMRAPLPFKGCGLKYIQFAKDEPELFKLLFMRGDDRDESTHFLPTDYKYCDDVLGAVKSKYPLPAEGAARIYNHLSVYTHGLAVLFAHNSSVFTMDDADRMLSEIFNALLKEENYEHDRNQRS